MDSMFLSHSQTANTKGPIVLISAVHLHHNCFALDMGAVVYLFDVPDSRHFPKACTPKLMATIANRRVIVFISHSHADHFNPDIVSLLNGAAHTRYVVSDDVVDLYPDAVPEDTLVVEPDETYDWEGLRIETLMSNDLGVAFLIDGYGLRVYFGGDLANWNWDTLGDRGKRSTEAFFQKAIDRVRKWKPHVAFSNVDDRLPGLAGGVEFVQQVRPELFVPMHTFGKTGVIEKLMRYVTQSASRVFTYTECGALLELEIEV